MFFGLMYPRAVKAWIRKARHEINYQNEAPIEDLKVPVRLELLSRSRQTELGRLLRDHKEYKERWTQRVQGYRDTFGRLESPDLSTFDQLSTLYELSAAFHASSEMKSLQHEPFYQSKEALTAQFVDLLAEISKRAENGSEEDFLLLRRFLNEVSGSHWPPYNYPYVYPELVDRYVESPSYEDYLVRSESPMTQARYSNSLNFLRLYIEQSGGSRKHLQSPIKLTHVGQYFDEIELYILYDIEKRIRELSKEEDENT